MMAQSKEGTAVPQPPPTGNDGDSEKKKRRKRKRWGDAPPAAAGTASTSQTTTASAAATDPKAKALALKESIAAKLAAIKKSSSTAATTAAVAAPAPKRKKSRFSDAPVEQQQPPVKKAKHYELDMSTTGPTYTTTTTKLPPKKKFVNPYLAHHQQQQDEEQPQSELQLLESHQDVDDRLVRSSKPRQRHKPMEFVEPGTFIELAERKRKRAANAAESGFVSGRKAGVFIESAGMAKVYGSALPQANHDVLPPRADACLDKQHAMPLVMEWWDMELLPSRLKKSVATQEGLALDKQTQAQLQQLSSNHQDEESSKQEKEQAKKLRDLEKECWDSASLSHSKTCTLVQHIVPVKPPGAHDGPSQQPTLHLTKRELKRQRKRRREEKQRRIQDEQAVGLRPPPEPRLTLKNFIQVLGDQAVLDPSQMEQKVSEQVQARQRAHLERNEARKLTKQEKKEKKIAKLTEDTSRNVSVAIFFVKDMQHTYHRTKVDLNAQQNYITGGVLECMNPPLACVICEGGPKAIKRYTRLMLVRMNWTGEGLEEEQDDEDEQDEADNTMENDGTATRVKHKFNSENKCELVWTGMAAKRMFSSFVFQSCETADTARKVLEAKGVAHFWDQVMTHASQGNESSFALKLTGDGNESEEENIVIIEE